ncbi:Tkl protein kinase [Globisporangium polare]
MEERRYSSRRIQLLLAHGGGSLRDSDVPGDEHPLIPGTLDTMRKMCAATFEFESLCSRVVQRLQDYCCQLQQKDEEDPVQESALTSFTSILFRFCRLVVDIAKLQTLLSRFISSRALSNRLGDFHEELDHFVDMLGLVHDGEEWRDTWDRDQVSQQLRFRELLVSTELLLDGCSSASRKREAALLLRYELKTREDGRSKLQDDTKMVLAQFLHSGGIEAPVVPDWFISRDDVEYYSWNVVRSAGRAKHYQGKWRQTSVMIETSYLARNAFEKAAAKWFQLSHPNVVQLFGACSIGSPFVFVYELVPEGRQLQEFLRDESNRVSLWKRLYEAALGLQYLHHRDVVHGDVRSENIIVGSDRVAKWNGVCEDQDLSGVAERSRLTWMAPELIQSLFDLPAKTAAADVYAFGMCVWEAVTLEVPWKGHSDHNIYSNVSEGMLPERPASIQDAEWDLITSMCTADPSERATIGYVVNRLKQFVLDHGQSSGAVVQEPSSSSGHSTQQRESVVEHLFGELGDTIPSALRMVQSKCERLSDEDQWMASSVYPALDYIFVLLQERNKVPTDVEVVKFCGVLSRFQHYLRTAVSEKSVFQLVRSRRVAESNHVIYSELDRLLDMLDVAETDPIRVWRGEPGLVGGDGADGVDSKDSTPTDSDTSNGSSEAVSLTYFPSPTANHALWTRDGLAASKMSPSWTLPLQDLEFSELNQIGQGAFGAVYKGTWLDTPVVIKFMGYEEDSGTISTDLLLHEVRVWHRLNHPHVLKFYGACHVDKRYLVCEFASGGELVKFLKKLGNEHLVWQKMYEAALGLQFLHSQNVAHNDLKCDNIMVGMDGNAKLIDFGLSCLLDEAEIQIAVKKMGAVHWRSPEYLAGGRPSFASDVYSFAMCIIEVVSGDIPWGKSVLPAMIRLRVKKGGLPPLPDSMNEKQRNLIQLMTKPEPSERVKIAFVMDKLHEIVQDEKSKRAP